MPDSTQLNRAGSWPMKWLVVLLLWAVSLACGGVATALPDTVLETRTAPDATRGVTATPTTEAGLPQATTIPETTEAYEPPVTAALETVTASETTPDVTAAPATKAELPQSALTTRTPETYEPPVTAAFETVTAPDPTPSVTTVLATKAGPPLQPTLTPEPSRPQAPTEEDPRESGPVVRIGSAEFAVELAITLEERAQGLSDRPHLAPDTGMLFVYQQQSRYSFWMRNMHFPLDILWISADCIVADASLNVPPPEPGRTANQLPRYSPAVPVQYVLEINAGEAAAKGITSGAGVEFTGDLAGRFGC